MDIQVFWNKAIEYHCLKDNNEVIFVAVSENSLEEIFDEYIDFQDDEEFQLQIKKIIETYGGVRGSYFQAITKELFNDNYGQYGFLKFSFFVLCAFNMETTAGYWRTFNNKLGKYTNQELYPGKRTQLIDEIIRNLKKYCIQDVTINKYGWQDGKDFLDINIYGDDSKWVNVGRIYAHSIFSYTSIKKVKKAMYELDYAYTKSIEFLTDEEISNILVKSNIPNVIKLFKNDEIRGLVNESLNLWLKNWSPNEEEENSFANKVYVKTDTQILRIWYWDKNESDLKFEWIHGFISKENLGSEGQIILNERLNIYINLDKSSDIGKDAFLYLIDNLDCNFEGSLENDLYNLKIKNPSEYYNDHFSLKNIKNSPYYLQIDKSKVLFSNEIVFIASNRSITDYKNIFCGKFSIDNENLQYYIYRVKDHIEYHGTKYIKTNAEIDIELNGITAGIAGKSIYLESYPITIIFGNIQKGQLEIYNSEYYLKHTFNLADGQYALNNTIMVNNLPSGVYKIKVRLENEAYIIFKNGETYKTFEITKEGSRDRRAPMKENLRYFEYSEYKDSVEFDNISSNFVMLFNNQQLFDNQELNHQLFDFCFKKDQYYRWYKNIDRKNLFFATILKADEVETWLGREIEKYVYKPSSYEYIDTNFHTYHYQAKAIGCYSTSFQINPEMYVADKFVANKRSVYLECYCYELTEFGVDLQEKYPFLLKGKTTYILSNDNVRFVPERLLQKVTQEIFPFKY